MVCTGQMVRNGQNRGRTCGIQTKTLKTMGWAVNWCVCVCVRARARVRARITQTGYYYIVKLGVDPQPVVDARVRGQRAVRRLVA